MELRARSTSNAIAMLYFFHKREELPWCHLPWTWQHLYLTLNQDAKAYLYVSRADGGVVAGSIIA